MNPMTLWTLTLNRSEKPGLSALPWHPRRPRSACNLVHGAYGGKAATDGILPVAHEDKSFNSHQGLFTDCSCRAPHGVMLQP